MKSLAPSRIQIGPAATRGLGSGGDPSQGRRAAEEDEQAIFEPGVGEIPLWNEMTLTALFEAHTDALILLSTLEAFDPGLDWSQARFERIEDQDWERAWLDTFQPMRFGARTWIVPWHSEAPAEAEDGVLIRLDPGLAFGSGTHATTALCLDWLDGLDLRGKDVLDFGCGRGNLAFAAARRGCLVTSTDYVAALLERGQDRARAEHLDVTFQVADAEARLAYRDAPGALDRFKAAQSMARRDPSADHFELSILDARTRDIMRLQADIERDAAEQRGGR